MIIKNIRVGIIHDSREKDTICINVNGQITCAPSGKSRGKHEKEPYKTSIKGDFKAIKQFLPKLERVNFTKFEDLSKIEKVLKNKLGANTLFALEASILKAIAKEQGKELWKFLNPKAKGIPVLISNTIGGGTHSKNLRGKKPDFQEFLAIGNKTRNNKAYNEARKLLKARAKNDESAWMTDLGNEEVLEIMKWAVRIGVDIAASQFYKNGKYHYKNPKATRTRKEQIEYVIELIKKYGIDYMEDPLHEEDFSGFAEILRKTRNCLIVGDDLTTTNLKRVKKAIKMKAINGLIVKPNQIGSLLEIKKIVDLCKRKKIKIIVSHRSGETIDYTIADLAVAWAKYIKIPISGRERLAKIERLEHIKKKI